MSQPKDPMSLVLQNHWVLVGIISIWHYITWVSSCFACSQEDQVKALSLRSLWSCCGCWLSIWIQVTLDLVKAGVFRNTPRIFGLEQEGWNSEVGELISCERINIRVMALVSPAEEVVGGLKDLSLNGGDPYREHLVGDAEAKTAWRHGGPPTYDVVNALFESGRTKVILMTRQVLSWQIQFCFCHAVVDVVVGKFKKFKYRFDLLVVLDWKFAVLIFWVVFLLWDSGLQGLSLSVSASNLKDMCISRHRWIEGYRLRIDDLQLSFRSGGPPQNFGFYLLNCLGLSYVSLERSIEFHKRWIEIKSIPDILLVVKDLKYCILYLVKYGLQNMSPTLKAQRLTHISFVYWLRSHTSPVCSWVHYECSLAAS